MLFAVVDSLPFAECHTNDVDRSWRTVHAFRDSDAFRCDELCQLPHRVIDIPA